MIPKVTKWPSLARSVACSTTAWKCLWSTILWSAGIITITVSRFCCIVYHAAKAMAGAVFLAAGSRMMVALCCPIVDSCSAAKKRWLSEHTRTADWVAVPEKRNRVSCSRERCAPMLRNCFGNSALDKGHRRVPMPPASITGVNVVFDLFIIVCILAELVD